MISENPIRTTTTTPRVHLWLLKWNYTHQEDQRIVIHNFHRVSFYSLYLVKWRSFEDNSRPIFQVHMPNSAWRWRFIFFFSPFCFFSSFHARPLPSFFFYPAPFIIRCPHYVCQKEEERELLFAHEITFVWINQTQTLSHKHSHSSWRSHYYPFLFSGRFNCRLSDSGVCYQSVFETWFDWHNIAVELTWNVSCVYNVLHWRYMSHSNPDPNLD